MAADIDPRDYPDRDAYYAALVADWPPLTPEQRDRLALLLDPGAGGHG